MHVGRCPVLLFVFILLHAQVSPITEVYAVGGRHGGLSDVEAILNSNFSIWTLSGHVGEDAANDIHAVAQAGIKFMHIEGWWSEHVNNPLDIFYNETFRIWAKEAINFSLYGILPSYEGGPSQIASPINPNDIWGITLGDEEPAWMRYVSIWDSLSPDIAKYNDTYFSETGHHLQPLGEMNRSEFWVCLQWLNEKSVWVYNYMHDYVRSLVPHALVFQYMTMPPAWGTQEETCAAYELKGEGFAMDCYYANEEPWLLYETIRAYRTSLPDRIFHLDIWGTIWDFVNEAGDGLYYREGFYEQMRHETWISYLSGVDALGYFDWAPENNDSYNWKWGHERTDIMGRRTWRYIDNLAGQLALLPSFNPEPEVLLIGLGYQMGEASLTLAGLKLFTEYDRVNQRCFATTDIDLTNYSLVLLTDGWYYNSTVTKLNEYVANGGNLLLLGGIRSSDEPLDESKEFQIEHNVNETEFGGHIYFNTSESNLLGLNLTFTRPYYWSYALTNDSLTSDYTPIGSFYLTEENSSYTKIEDYPLLLFHNTSAPESGYVLYFGAYDATTDLDREPDKKPELWNLYRPIVRAYADFLGITNSISTEEIEDMILTAAQISPNTILAGAVNLRNEGRLFIFTYDLSQLGFAPGSYYVHSLDRDQSEGRYDTNGNLLSFETDVLANGTRLYLISQNEINPGYSIDIFPKVPSISDVTETTTTSETTSSTTSPSPNTTTTSDGYLMPVLILSTGVAAGTLVIALVVFIRKRGRK
ncbi:hypothetical protein EU537_08880 [Candidatus Thorarchaeota archaeon]|nr:MAG: hypothetical protein EU537_08880 [Candidatus Thorarchaeota archaeon]